MNKYYLLEDQQQRKTVCPQKTNKDLQKTSSIYLKLRKFVKDAFPNQTKIYYPPHIFSRVFLSLLSQILIDWNTVLFTGYYHTWSTPGCRTIISAVLYNHQLSYRNVFIQFTGVVCFNDFKFLLSFKIQCDAVPSTAFYRGN